VKILVVDDHALIRTALRGILAQLDAHVTLCEASDCSRAFELIEADADLDLVLLDLNMPGRSGFDALAEMRMRYPALPVVVLSSVNDRESVTRALDLGAAGYVPKLSSNEVLVSALRLVLSGGVYLPPELLARSGMPHRPSSQAESAHSAMRRLPATLDLTGREAQVLRLLLEGKSNKLICRELDLADSTVKNHVSQILKALNVTSRTQAVIAAARLGITIERAS
jgi:DNA-binding NarL/FixJ family response regulator